MFAGLIAYISISSQFPDIRISLAGYFIYLVLSGLVMGRVWRKAWWTNLFSYMSLYWSGFMVILAIPGWNDLANERTDIISFTGVATAFASAFAIVFFVQFWLSRRQTTKLEADGDNIGFEQGATVFSALLFLGIVWYSLRKVKKYFGKWEV